MPLYFKSWVVLSSGQRPAAIKVVPICRDIASFPEAIEQSISRDTAPFVRANPHHFTRKSLWMSAP